MLPQEDAPGTPTQPLGVIPPTALFPSTLNFLPPGATPHCNSILRSLSAPFYLPRSHPVPPFLLKTECQGNKPVAKCFDAPSEHPESQIPGRRPHGSPAQGHRRGLHTESFELLLLFFAQLGTFCMFSPPASENRKI